MKNFLALVALLAALGAFGFLSFAGPPSSPDVEMDGSIVCAGGGSADSLSYELATELPVGTSISAPLVSASYSVESTLLPAEEDNSSVRDWEIH